MEATTKSKSTNFLQILTILFITSQSTQDVYTPYAVTVVMNKGPHTPKTNNFEIPFFDEFSEDTLLPNGERMMFILGSQIRKNYEELAKLAEKAPEPRGRFYASQSSASQASLQAFLTGLWPKIEKKENSQNSDFPYP